ncbi:hypothetical protein TUBRATIS_17690 [Tubulinosema ratisbonensis]|uniref:Uncharacterized protein n=1 Tax=Tubulinosema ratisbonensis TaxID=291195 RepID=A0A437AL83_9MICR|nr:hypothetical protein TUBRATIS_17690 [Tubulinosema ratisbonensis]
MQIGTKNFISSFEMIFATGFIMLGTVILWFLFEQKGNTIRESVQKPVVDASRANSLLEFSLEAQKTKNLVDELSAGQPLNSAIPEPVTSSDVPTQSTTSPIFPVENKIENEENKNHGEVNPNGEIQDEHSQADLNISSTTGPVVTKNPRNYPDIFDMIFFDANEEIRRMQEQYMRLIQLNDDMMYEVYQPRRKLARNKPSNSQESEHYPRNGRRTN